MEQEKSYLQRLVFDPKLNFGIISSYLKNFRLTILLILTILIGGIVSYLNIPQRLNPQINIPIVSVTTVLPGASPQDIESLITIPLEDQINTITGIDTLTSISNENVSVLSIQFVSGTDPKAAEQEVKAAVDKVTNLPTDAQDPTVKAFDFEDQPIWTFTISTKEDLPSLMSFSEKLTKAIEKSNKVDRVEKAGYETKEVHVVISPEKLREYNLNPQVLFAAVKQAAQAYPSGTVVTDNNTLSLTINPQITTKDDLRNLRISVQNNVVNLGDIAEITEQTQDNQPKSFLASATNPAQRVVTINVYKTRSADINKTSDEVKQLVDQELKKADNRFTITTVINTSDEIRKQFTDLLNEFATTVLLVFVCLLLFVGLRQAAISSITVPLTFLSAFMLMPFFGMSINFLSLFAFLLSLGLLIDDTIVVVSAMTSYYRSGKFSIFETGRLVWKDNIIPIWSTTLTTIWAFIPLLLASGIIGEFIKPIPIVIALTMISSTAIAVLITLPLMIIILKPQIPQRVLTFLRLLFFIGVVILIFSLAPKNAIAPFIIATYFVLLFVLIKIRKPIKEKLAAYNAKPTKINRLRNLLARYADRPVLNLEIVAEKYKSVIRRVLGSKDARRKTLAAVIIFALISYALLPLGLIKNEFFPKTDAETIYVNIEYPTGTNLNIVTDETTLLLDELRKTEGVSFIKTDIGRAVNLNSSPSGNTQNSVAYTLHLTERGKRNSDSIEIAENLRKKYSSYSKGKLSVLEQTDGPPAGADIQIELSGDELTALDSYANKISDYLKTRQGLTNINKSLKPGPSQIVFIPNKSEMAKNNVSLDTIGFWMRLFASGFELEKIKFANNGSDEERILLKLGYNQRSIEELGKIAIPLQNGTTLPLNALGTLSAQESPTQITRENRKRTINISAAVQVGKANTTEEGQKLEQFADSLNLPDGYAWKTGGVNEENAKSVQSIIQAMGVAFVLILLTMVIQFGSFRQAFIALAVIPLAVSGVFFVFAITGTPLSFPALIGVLALFGIIVTNSMFIIDKINLNRKQGMPFLESVADAGASRLEPIVLTKLSTVLGLLPITLSEPLWRGLGGAIISGVLLASTFMLLFIPVVYYSFFAKEEEEKDQRGVATGDSTSTATQLN